MSILDDLGDRIQLFQTLSVCQLINKQKNNEVIVSPTNSTVFILEGAFSIFCVSLFSSYVCLF